MKVKTLRRHGYGRKMRRPGEEYEIAKEKDVMVLEAVGKIRRIASVQEKPVVARRERPKKPKSRRRYRRKDMAAENPVVVEVNSDDEDTDEVNADDTDTGEVNADDTDADEV
jgi:hypothetical protein